MLHNSWTIEANGQLAHILVTKLSGFMEQLELIKSKYELEKDLSKNDLLKKDLKKIVGNSTPFIPFIVLIRGGITVGGHVVSKMSQDKKKVEEENDKNSFEEKAE